jgi:hypothetical protein
MVSKKERSEIGRMLAALRKQRQVKCVVCGKMVTGTKRRMYCSARCNVAAYRERKRHNPSV